MSTSTLLLRIYLALSFFVLTIKPSYCEVITDGSKSFFIDKTVENFPKIGNDKRNGVFHLITHGRPGELLINGQWKNAAQIAEFVRHSSFGSQLSTSGNGTFRRTESEIENPKSINIYGCEFGKGEKGREAVAYLANTLGVSVAASDDITGKDGDWDLEVGNNATALAIPEYQGNLQMHIVPTDSIVPDHFLGYRTILNPSFNYNQPNYTGGVYDVDVNSNGVIGVGGSFVNYFNQNTAWGQPHLNFQQLNFDQATTHNNFVNTTITGSTSNVVRILALRSGSFVVEVNTGSAWFYRVDPNGTVTYITGNTYAGPMIEDPVQNNIVYISNTYTIQKWNVGGTTPAQKTNWTITPPTNYGFYDFAFSKNGKLLAAETDGLIAYDTTASANVPSTILVNGSTTHGILAVAVQSDGKIVFGGLNMQDGTKIPTQVYLARLNADFTIDNTFYQHLSSSSRYETGGTNVSAAIECIEIGPGDVIYIAGNFSHLVNWEAIGSVAKLSKDGVLDQTWIQNFRSVGNAYLDGNIYIGKNFGGNIRIQPDGNLLVGGNFVGVNSLWHGGLIRVKPNGVLDVAQYASSSPGTSLNGLNVLINSFNRNSHGVIYRQGEESSYNKDGYHPSYYGRTNDNDLTVVGKPTRYDVASDKFIVAYYTGSSTNNIIMCHNLDGTVKWKLGGAALQNQHFKTDISSDGKYYATTIDGTSVNLYDANNGSLIKTITPPASAGGAIMDVVFNPSGNYLYLLSLSQNLYRYNAADGTVVGTGTPIPCNNPTPYTVAPINYLWQNVEFYTDTDMYFVGGGNGANNTTFLYKNKLVDASGNPSTLGTNIVFDTSYGVNNGAGFTGMGGFALTNYSNDAFGFNTSGFTTDKNGNFYVVTQRETKTLQTGQNIGGCGVIRVGPKNINGLPDVNTKYILTTSSADMYRTTASDQQNQNLLDWGTGLAVTCNAGTTAPTLNGAAASNVCPATTVDLTGKVTSTAPSGSHVVWSSTSTASLPTDTLTNTTAVTAGTYYAYYYDPVNQCFSPASSGLVVTITQCCPTITNGVGDSYYPSTCGGSDGSIRICGMTASSTGWTVSYDKNGTPATALTNQTADANGCIIITGLTEGSYTNIKVTHATNCPTGSNTLSTTLGSIASLYIVDAAATMAANTIAVNGGTYNLVYTYVSGPQVMGTSFTVPVTYSDMTNTISSSIDNQWAGFGVLQSYVVLLPNTNTPPSTGSIYSSLPSTNTQAENYTTPNFGDAFFSTWVGNGTFQLLGTFNIEVGSLPTLPAGVTLISDALNTRCGTNLSTNGNGQNQGGFWEKPQSQTAITSIASSRTLPYDIARNTTIPYKYSAFSDGSVYPSNTGARGVGIYGEVQFTTGCCNAGTTAPTLSATTLGNVCPSPTADLTLPSLVTSTCPTGSSLEWHTANTGLSASNLVSNPTAVLAGTYYAVCHDATNNCYSPASSGLVVTIAACPCTDPLKMAANCDFDGDGVINALDLDDDNDGILDSNEGCINTEFGGNNTSMTSSTGIQIMYSFTNSATPMKADNNLNAVKVAVTPVPDLTASNITTAWTASASIDISNVASTTLAEAEANAEYLQFTFTTNSAFSTANVDWVGFLNRVAQPGFSATIEISSNGTNFTQLATFVEAANVGGGTYPAGRQNAKVVNTYNINKNTTYTVRVYLM